MTVSVYLLSAAYLFMVLFVVVVVPVNIVVVSLAKKALDLDASGEPVEWFVSYQGMILLIESGVVGFLVGISLGISLSFFVGNLSLYSLEFGLAVFVGVVLVMAVATIALMIQNRIMKEVFCFTAYALKRRLMGAYTEKFFAGCFVLLFVMTLLSFGCVMIDILDYVGASTVLPEK